MGGGLMGRRGGLGWDGFRGGGRKSFNGDDYEET